MTKTLYVRIDAKVHFQYKTIAGFHNKTLEQWVSEACAEKFTREKAYLDHDSWVCEQKK